MWLQISDSYNLVTYRDKELRNNSRSLKAKIDTAEGEAVVSILHWTQALKTKL